MAMTAALSSGVKAVSSGNQCLSTCSAIASKCSSVTPISESLEGSPSDVKDDLRYSWGFGIAWISPLGPLKFSLAFPINKKDGDKTQRFQFQIGTGF